MKTELTTIPNIGEKTKKSLINIGITSVEDLRGKNPEDLYIKDCIKKDFKKTNVSYTSLEWQYTMQNIQYGKKKS